MGVKRKKDTVIDSILTSELEISRDDKWGPRVTLKNWEQTDYIEDVFAEHFGLDYEFKVSDDDEKRYALFFAEKASFDEVEKAVKAINEFHRSTGKVYETI